MMPHGNQYHNMEQYNSLMAQLLKSQQKSSSSVVGPSYENKSSNRTRTKSNATSSSIQGVGGKEVSKTTVSKGSVKASSNSHFTGNSN